MSDQDIQTVPEPESNREAPDQSAQTDERAEPARPEIGTASGAREDDRNEELEESPVPDPQAKDTDAADDPQAD
jgi:hypothetical protein